MASDQYKRERERPATVDGMTAGIILTSVLVVIGVLAVTFVYWRG